jgi:pimeloyl-ACP methyl ester carboxylesterase
LKAGELTLKHLVLLPGLDGTGKLFADFIAALPPSLIATTVSYPTDRFLPYTDLQPFVSESVPKSERFVLVAESFSTPLAVSYAATSPPNLAAVVICAGFIGNPVGKWSKVVRALAKPWFFRLRPPRLIYEYFLVGRNAPPPLVQNLRRVLQGVNPEVLSARVREVLNCNASDDLRRTKAPLMYLRAGNDKLLSAYCGDEISQIRPDTLYKLIPAPHLILQREPQRAAWLITTFIQQLDTPA